MLLIHAFDQYDFPFFLFSSKFLLLLSVLSLIRFGIAGIFEEIFCRPAIMNLQIIHFNLEGSLVVDFEYILYKVFTFVIFLHIFLLQQPNSSEKLL